MTTAAFAVTLPGGLVFLALAVWRPRTRTFGRWLVLAGIAAALTAVTAADWMLNGSSPVSAAVWALAFVLSAAAAGMVADRSGVKRGRRDVPGPTREGRAP